MFLRMAGKTVGNRDFDTTTIELVWRKGIIVPGYDPSQFRKDCCGAWMERGRHGDISHNFGWEVDHIVPVFLGGT